MNWNSNEYKSLEEPEKCITLTDKIEKVDDEIDFCTERIEILNKLRFTYLGKLKEAESKIIESQFTTPKTG